VSAWHNKNDLPLLWQIQARHRGLLFQIVDLLQDARLLEALSLRAGFATLAAMWCWMRSISDLPPSAGRLCR
jgi:hypothetical protein